ncbi:hypothetical protein R3P38DRAFT_3239602 [Favolaschia claudopus]|uniref:F-box domain-containing protein n=1 Tax=Favolaschia claudopus TaxID=2862362 RepID=A0AAV9Z949_9AGAR
MNEDTGLPLLDCAAYESCENLVKRTRWLAELKRIDKLPPTSVVWTALLSTMDIHFLFLICTRSKVYFDAVINYIQTVEPDWASANEYLVPVAPGGFLSLPQELRQYVCEFLDLRERAMLGATCRCANALVRRILRICVADLFKPYGISYRVVNFMQVATGTIISGSSITRLSMARRSSRAFNPNDIDMYSPHSSWPHVVRFLEIATQFRLSKHQTSTYGLPGLSDIGWMTKGQGNALSLNIMRCSGEHVYEPILQFHSSCVIGGVDASGLWLANPKLLFEAKSIINRPYLNLETDASRQRAFAVLQKYMNRGISFHVDYNVRHTCGKSKSCPASIRHMQDRGCMRMKFATAAYGSSALGDNRFPGQYVLSWSYGGLGCSRGVRRAASGMQVLPVFDEQVYRWRKAALKLKAKAKAALA